MKRYRHNLINRGNRVLGAILGTLLITFGPLAGVVSADRLIPVNGVKVNGGNSVTVNAGASITLAVTVTTTLTAGANSDDWQSTGYRIGGGPTICVDHTDYTTAGTYNESFPITAPAVAGSYDVQVRAFRNNALPDCSDGAGTSNTFTLTNGIVVDTTAPATPTHLSPPNGVRLKTSNLSIIDWSDVSDPATPVTYQYQSSTSSATNPDGSFVTPAYTSGALVSSDINAAGTPEGTYYWHVRATDGVGNTSAWSSAWTIIVDNTAPIISAHINESQEATGPSGAIVTYTSPATSDAVDGAGIASCLPASGTTFAIGDTTVFCNASDIAGNPAVTTSFTVSVVDTTAPATAPLISPTDNSIWAGPIQITGATTDSVGVDSINLYARLVGSVGYTFIKNIDLANSPLELFNFTWDPSTEGFLLTDASFDIMLTGLDLAGNEGTGVFANNVIFDIEGPSLTVSNLPDDCCRTRPFTINGTVSDTNGINDVRVRFQDTTTLATYTFTATIDISGNWSLDINGTNFVPDGNYNVRIRARDVLGNQTTKNKQNVTVDSVNPTLNITNPTNGTTLGGTQDIRANISDPHLSEYRVIVREAVTNTQVYNSGWLSAPSTNMVNQSVYSWDTTTVADGSYEIVIRARDCADNQDSTHITVTVDNTAPDTVIDSSPASITNSTSANFIFHSTETPSTFECSLDGAAFSSCASPQAYAGLAEGVHTFSVRATDQVGNTDASPATFAWTIDTTAPDTVIDTTPASLTTSTTASFDFHSTELPATFECSLDAAAFTSCVSPQVYSILADGSHTFKVQAIDQASNADATPASFTWVIDTTAPTVTINSLNTTTQSPAITGTVNDPTATISVTVGGHSYPATNNGNGTWTLAAGTISPALAIGTYDVVASATDTIGNSATDATTNELVIAAPPVTPGLGGANTNNSQNDQNEATEQPSVEAEKTGQDTSSSNTTPETDDTKGDKKTAFNWWWSLPILLAILLGWLYARRQSEKE